MFEMNSRSKSSIFCLSELFIQQTTYLRISESEPHQKCTGLCEGRSSLQLLFWEQGKKRLRQGTLIETHSITPHGHSGRGARNQTRVADPAESRHTRVAVVQPPDSSRFWSSAST